MLDRLLEKDARSCAANLEIGSNSALLLENTQR
jgi:hypothetical protein